jgi:hypothetical protein
MTRVWDKEDLERVRSLALLGWSASQIGNEIGKTRNSIIGVMNRNKIPSKIRGNVSINDRKNPKERVARNSKKKIKLFPFQKSFPFMDKVIESPKSPPKPLMDAKRSECKYIVHTDHDQPFKTMCCGDWIFRGTSWCKFHYSIVYLPPRTKGK